MMIDWKLVRKNDSKVPGTMKKVKRKAFSKVIHNNPERPYSVDDELSLHKDVIKILIEHAITSGVDSEKFSEFLQYVKDTEILKDTVREDMNKSISKV